MLAWRHIKLGLISKLLLRACSFVFQVHSSWHEFYLLSLTKCAMSATEYTDAIKDAKTMAMIYLQTRYLSLNTLFHDTGISINIRTQYKVQIRQIDSIVADTLPHYSVWMHTTNYNNKAI